MIDLAIPLESIADDRAARVALNFALPVNHRPTERLVRDYGATQTIRFAIASGSIPGLDTPASAVWRQHFAEYDVAQVGARLDHAARQGVRLLVPGDAEWPTALNDLGEETPLALWVRGSGTELLQLPLEKRTAVVGSRVPSKSGVEETEEMVRGLIDHGLTLVASDMKGVSREAIQASYGSPHQAIAVIAAGADTSYYAKPNHYLYYVAQGGLILSEAPPGAIPNKNTMEGRARIIASLAGAAVMLEGGAYGFPADTIHRSLSLGRLTAAVPGEPERIFKIGANAFIGKLDVLPVADGRELGTLIENIDGLKQQHADINLQIDRPHTQNLMPEVGRTSGRGPTISR